MTYLAMRLNADVLHIVFGHLDDPAQPNERGKALVNAAMACKDFYQPALRIIWRKLDDLFPLFKLFSSFVMVRAVPNGKREENLYMIDGAILPGEWERFRMHAEFVHTLGRSHSSSFSPWAFLPDFRNSRCIAPSALSYLSRLASGAPLLPNLRRLHWAIASTQCTALFPLISPSLDALTLVPPDLEPGPDERREWQASIRSTLFLIVSVATNITELELDWEEEHSIAEPVAQLRSLRCFKTARADGNLLRILAGLPSLEKLTLGTILVSEQDTFMQAGEGFTYLESFSVKRHPSTSRFYQLFKAPGLRYLNARFYGMDDHRDVLMCCTAWAKCFPSLKNLELFVTLKGDADHLPRPYSSIMEPLFQLRSLRTVIVSALPGQFVPSDADIEAVARSWSELVRFSTDDTVPQERAARDDADPCIGPSALVSLATRCPRLLALQIPRAKINLTNIDALSDFPVLDHRLRTLSVRSMYSDDCSLTALFLDRLFPHLQTVIPSTRSKSTWNRVQHHIEVCQTARLQEVQRIASSAPVARIA